MARRAEDYYRSARELLPLIDRESRPALWVLVSIYHALLKRIERADYDVFTRRASVPTVQKIAILASRPGAHDLGAHASDVVPPLISSRTQVHIESNRCDNA